MISEFEQKLADVLGSRLPAPFGGRVQVPPAPAAGPNPAIVVGTTAFESIDPDLGSRRPELAPGVADTRRILRLRCSVAVQVQPGSGGRTQLLQGIDASLFALDAADFRNGTALAAPGDPGFLIQDMRIVGSLAAADPNPPSASPQGVMLAAEGWFWPAGTAGQAGVAIVEVRVRGGILPIEVSPAHPLSKAGGPPFDITLTVRSFTPMRLHKGAAALPALPFGSLALAVFGPGGRPGAGTLSGGTAGAAGVQLISLAEGSAKVTYTPPATAAVDELHVTIEDSAGGLGVELGRFPITVKGA